MDFLRSIVIIVITNCVVETSMTVTNYTGPLVKIWPRSQCDGLGHFSSNTPEGCMEECTRRDGCSAFNYNTGGAGGGCFLRKCTLPVPEPNTNLYWYSGYAFDPEHQLSVQQPTTIKSTVPVIIDTAQTSLIFPTHEIKANEGEEVNLDCGVKIAHRSCLWETNQCKDIQVEDVCSGIYNKTYGKPSITTDNQCGITINNVSTVDVGEWTCKVLVIGNTLSNKLLLVIVDADEASSTEESVKGERVEGRDEEDDQLFLVMYGSAAVLGIVVLIFLAAGLYLYCRKNNEKQQSAEQPENPPHSTPMGMLNRHVSENSLYMANTDGTSATTSPRSRHDSENSLYESFSKDTEAETNVNRGSRHDSENSLYASARQ